MDRQCDVCGRDLSPMLQVGLNENECTRLNCPEKVQPDYWGGQGGFTFHVPPLTDVKLKP